ncbi:MAG: sensor histidine kinase [bacterium]
MSMCRNSDSEKSLSEKISSVLELAVDVSHEMNQPLTGISGFCALIKEQISEAEPIYQDVLQIEKQARRLEQLVNKFQSIAQIEASSLNLEQENRPGTK